MIERNRHPTGRIGNIGFGVIEVLDGLVRVLTFGFFHTRGLCAYTSWQTRRAIEVMKAKRMQKKSIV